MIIAIAAFRGGFTNSDRLTVSSKIIYIDDTGSGLWQINPNGENNVRLADAPSTNILVLSPNEKMIAFALAMPEENGNSLFLMDIDGKNIHPIRKKTEISQGDDMAVSRSSDGNRLFYISRREADNWEFTFRSINLDGSDEKTIDFEPLKQLPFTNVSWSPDGNHVLIKGGNDAQSEYQATVFNSYGSASNLIYKGPLMEFGLNAWSPDGTKLAYTVKTYKESALNILYVTNADGSNAQAINLNVDAMGEMAWSPDNSQIAFWDYPNDPAVKALSHQF